VLLAQVKALGDLKALRSASGPKRTLISKAAKVRFEPKLTDFCDVANDGFSPVDIIEYN